MVSPEQFANRRLLRTLLKHYRNLTELAEENRRLGYPVSLADCELQLEMLMEVLEAYIPDTLLEQVHAWRHDQGIDKNNAAQA